MRVRALRDHIQPEAHTYRKEGEEFEYTGKPYDHVEKVKPGSKSEEEKEPETEDEGK